MTMRARVSDVASPQLVDRPVASVMMLTWNHEAFVRQAVESAVTQEAPFDYEVVIGDDGSTDRTPDLLRALQAAYPHRVRLLLRKRNAGAATNAHDVIRACRGSYIAMLEGDDYWTDPAKLGDQIALLERDPAALMCGARALVWRDGTAAPDGVAPEGDPATLASFGRREMVRGHWWFRTCTKVIPASVMRSVPTRFAGDWSATLWLLGSNPDATIAFLDRVVAVYRLHPSGTWSALSPAGQMWNDVRTLCQVIPRFSGEDRTYLINELHRRVEGLQSDTSVTTRVRLAAALRAVVCCPDHRTSWQQLAAALRVRPAAHEAGG